MLPTWIDLTKEEHESSLNKRKLEASPSPTSSPPTRKKKKPELESASAAAAAAASSSSSAAAAAPLPPVVWRGFARIRQLSDKEAIDYWQARDPIRDAQLPLRSYQVLTATAAADDCCETFTVEHPPGSGKTETAILYAELSLKSAILQQHNFGCRVLIVGPAGLLSNFYHGLLKHGCTLEHIRRYYGFRSFDEALIQHAQFLHECADNIVIIEECHEIKSTITLVQNAKPSNTKIYWGDGVVKSGKKAAAVLLGARLAKKRLAITGTLLVNDLSDICNLVALYDGGDSYPSWIKPTTLKRHQSFADVPSLSTYLDRMFQGRISYLRFAEVCQDMPTTDETNVLLQMNPDYYRRYMEMERETEEKFGGDDCISSIDRLNEPGPFWCYLRQVTDEMPQYESAKRKFILRLLHRFPDRPMVISTNFKAHGIVPLVTDLDRLGHTYAVIDGDRSFAERLTAQHAFNTGAARIILVSRAGSTGFNLRPPNTDKLPTLKQVLPTWPSELQKLVAEYEGGGVIMHVNLEFSWNEASKKQASWRSIRINSARHVHIYNLILVKPHELDKTFRMMQEHIQLGLAGAPNHVVACSADVDLTTGLNSLDEDEEKDLVVDDDDTDRANRPAVDLILQRIQMRKSKIIHHAYSHFVQNWSLCLNTKDALNATSAKSVPPPPLTPSFITRAPRAPEASASSSSATIAAAAADAAPAAAAADAPAPASAAAPRKRRPPMINEGPMLLAAALQMQTIGSF